MREMRVTAQLIISSTSRLISKKVYLKHDISYRFCMGEELGLTQDFTGTRVQCEEIRI